MQKIAKYKIKIKEQLSLKILKKLSLKTKKQSNRLFKIKIFF